MPNFKTNASLTAAAALLLASAGSVSSTSPESSTASPLSSADLPPRNLTSTSLEQILGGVKEFHNVDHRITPEELHGKAVLVYFWATWCMPCVAKIPVLNELAQKEGLEVIAITAEPSNKMANFVSPKSSRAVTAIVVSGAEDLRANLHVDAFPTAILFSPEGKVLDRWIPVESHKEFAQKVEAAISQEHPTAKVKRVQGANFGVPDKQPTNIPASAQGFALESFDQWVDDVKARSKKGEKISAEDLDKFVEFHSKNLPVGDWTGDPGIRYEVIGNSCGFLDLMRRSGGAGAEEILQLQLKCLRRWLFASSPDFEPKASIREMLASDMVGAAKGFSPSQQEQMFSVLNEALAAEKSVLVRVAIERALYIARNGKVEIEPSKLNRADIDALTRELQDGVLRIQLDKLKSKDDLSAARAIFDIYPRSLLPQDPLFVKQYAAANAITFALMNIAGGGEIPVSKSLLQELQPRVMALWLKCSGADQLLDHRFMLRMQELGVDTVSNQLANQVLARIDELQAKYAGPPRNELWFTMQGVKELILARNSVSTTESGNR